MECSIQRGDSRVRLVLLFQEQFIKTPFNIKINTHILTDAIYRKHRVQWNKTYSTIALLGNGIFYSISRDHKQPIKRSEFNKVLYDLNLLITVILAALENSAPWSLYTLHFTSPVMLLRNRGMINLLLSLSSCWYSLTERPFKILYGQEKKFRKKQRNSC
jgi:hypothetical protein